MPAPTPSPRTLNELFLGAVERYADRPVALRAKVAGAWTALSYRDLLERVEAFSLGLRELGLRPGDRVALLSENRPEWAVADYACLAAGCADVPIYPTLPPGQIEYILRDAGAAAVCVSSRAQLEKVRQVRGALPALRHVVAFDPGEAGGDVLGFEDVLARGRAARERHPAWRAEALAARPGDLATLIYTSGTTGDPKGVMLTHGNIASNVVASLRSLHLGPPDECLSFLPLSHIFERMAGHYIMLHAGVVINYAGSIDTVPADMMERRPSVVLAVPRFYEKIYARVLEGARGGPALKRRIFHWAKRTGERWADLVLERRPVPPGLALAHRLADRLVFAKIRARTGGKIRFFVSGGAPLPPEIARFFFAARLPILEGYGLTETSPVIAVNTFEHLRLGTVGRPIEGVEVRIAEDGEILTRGPHVMQGYHGQPAATAEVIDAEGWLHTGDVGVLDEDGFLRITDRKKDLIVTAGGKNIAPQPIENRLKANRFVANAVMLGDGRRFPIVLVVPNFDALKAWALEQRLLFPDDRSLVRLPEVVRKMEEVVAAALGDLAPFERPKRVLLLPQEFSVETGELTPTLKVKRRVVERKYKEQIDALYAGAPGGEHEMVG